MKHFIQNPAHEKIAVLVEGLKNPSPKGMVFIAHGMSGYKEHHLVRIPAVLFLQKDMLLSHMMRAILLVKCD